MATIESRLARLEVYADEDMVDHEARLNSMEALYKDLLSTVTTVVSDRIYAIEEAVSQVPRSLIDHWDEIENKMTSWHKEEKDRKEALRAVWKRMDEMKDDVRKIQDSVETASNGGEIEDIKINFSNELKEVYAEVESRRRNERFKRWV